MSVFEDVKKEDIARLLKSGYQMQTTKTIHEDLRLSKDNVTLVLYKTGKLLVQGKNPEKVIEHLEKLKIGDLLKPEHFRKEIAWEIIAIMWESKNNDIFDKEIIENIYQFLMAK